jgi:parallel beta-helix repeat protein
MVGLKKNISVLFVLLFLLLALSLMNLHVSAEPEGMVLVVDPSIPGAYSTIQAAINAANSSDTVFVHEGTYQESIQVNKSVSLIGQDVDNTIIAGQSADFAVSITVAKASVSSFTITRSVTGQSSIGVLVMRSYTAIRSNKIVGMAEGILLYSPNNVIAGNVILSSTSDGLRLYFSDNNVFSNNLITNNSPTVGINLYSSSNNVFSGNTISNCSQGVSISFFSNYNVFYHNNFYSPVQVSTSVISNTWALEGQGNFWSDYNGTDSNGDGIGDAPYVIDSRNQDDFPLAGTFSSFDVAVASEVYTTTIISNSTISDFRFEVGPETGNKMIHFDVSGEKGMVGFCRVAVPSDLMNDSLILFVGEEEVVPTVLNATRTAQINLYFTYSQSNQTVTIISSETLSLYNELLGELLNSQAELNSLNMTYNSLLANFTAQLQRDLHDLSGNYTAFLSKFSELQQSLQELNASYNAQQLDYQNNMQNMRNLTYILAGGTAILIVSAVYLSKRAHTPPTKALERREPPA